MGMKKCIVIILICIVGVGCCYLGGVVYKHEKWQSNSIHEIEARLVSSDSNSTTVYDTEQSELMNGITIASKGGEGLGCPPNSQISAVEAYNNGYDGYRINVCKTKDGVLVCSHDKTINNVARKADGSEIEENIFISEHTLEEINRYDFGIRYGSMYAGQKITLFEDMVATTAKLGLKLDIEWKSPTPVKSDYEQIYEMIAGNGYSNKNWHWIAGNKERITWFRDICDYVDIEVSIKPDKIDWDLIDFAMSPNHDVIVGYWKKGISEENMIKLHKMNIRQNKGTAHNAEELISDIESGVTELEANFRYPKKALIEYACQFSK